MGANLKVDFTSEDYRNVTMMVTMMPEECPICGYILCILMLPHVSYKSDKMKLTFYTGHYEYAIKLQEAGIKSHTFNFKFLSKRTIYAAHLYIKENSTSIFQSLEVLRLPNTYTYSSMI